MALVNMTLNGTDVQVESGMTILEAASANGIRIPTLCHDEQLEPFASCWICAVKLEGMKRYVPSCGTKVAEGMKVWTDTEDVRAVRRMALELLLSNHRGDCVAPCKEACPASVDVQGYIALIAQGRYRDATKLVKQVNPFPLSIGRVCTRPCEGECRRNAVDGPVCIDYLKRFAADWDISHPDPYSPPVAPPSGHKVAAVGAGPASLTAAYYLAQAGHAVTIFEALPDPGGMLRYGIPEYRLPKRTLDDEIGLITGLGVDVKYGQRLGCDFTLSDLFDQGYEAVFLGLGAMASRKMRCPGEELDGVWAGTDFLGKMGLNDPPAVGRHVAIIGGGNTAVDAARTSLRLGAEKVTIVYRRSRKEMPAWDVEVDAAEEEGVEMHFLAAPTKIEGDGRCERLEFIRMELGEPDESGRRRPVPVEGSESVIDVDNVIAAIGQLPNLDCIQKTAEKDPDSLEAKLGLTHWGTIIADERSGLTAVPGVFAGGDVVNGAATAIEAIAAGGRAAAAIIRMFRGEAVDAVPPYFNIQEERWDSFPAEELADVVRQERQEMPELPVAERIKTLDEVELGLTEEQALEETKRCLECGCAEGFSCQLRDYAAEYGVTLGRFSGEVVSDPPDERHPFIRIEPEKCIMCGRCIRICQDVQGASALGFYRRGFVAQMKPALCEPLAQTDCESCGQCVESCPTGALTAKPVAVKPGPWDLVSTVSTCGFCGTGCSVDLCTVAGDLVSIAPASGVGVNEGNLCVRGRFGFRGALGERITAPRVKGSESSWDRALDAASEGLAGGAFFGSPRMTNEEAYALMSLAGASAGATGSFGLAGEGAVFGALSRVLGHASSTATYEDVRNADVVLVIDSDIAEEQTVAAISVRKAVRRGAALVVIAERETRLASLADVWIPAGRDQIGSVLSAMINHGLAEGSIDPASLGFSVSGLAGLKTSIDGITPDALASKAGMAVDGLKRAATLFCGAERAVTIANAAAFAPATACGDAHLTVVLATLAGSSGGDGSGILFLRVRANGQGLSDLGFEPAGGLCGPSCCGSDSGDLWAAVEAGRVTSALIVGEDPVGGAADPERVKAALGRLEHLVVMDSVETATAAIADIVIPMAPPTGAGGSYTNSEHRVQPVAAVHAVSAGRATLEILATLAARAGVEVPGTADKAYAALRAPLANLGMPERPDGSIWSVPGRSEGRPMGGDAALAPPDCRGGETLFDPRWTDAIEARFSRMAEEQGLSDHVVRRVGVSA